jgi:putative zinc finger/helix-turn-helix YgiT family protein
MMRFSNVCPTCKNPTLNTTRENYLYTSCGLNNVTLIDIDMRRCSRCGWSSAVIPNIDGLHKLLAKLLIEKKSRLNGGEFRFLRKQLGESSSDFASLIGVSAETVSRWETGREPVSAVADRLLRVLVITLEPRETYPTVKEQIKDVSRDVEASPTLLGLRPIDKGWESASLSSSE